MPAIKKHKVPETWNATTAAIIDNMFADLFEQQQSKYFDIVTAKPSDETGKNGEIKVDKTANKLYVKYEGEWHEVALT